MEKISLTPLDLPKLSKKPKAKTPEGKVKERIKTILTDLGCWWFMPVAGDYGRIGVPDFIACYKGRFVGIEAKSIATTHGVTALQRKTLNEIESAQGVGLVIDETNVENLKELLNEH